MLTKSDIDARCKLVLPLALQVRDLLLDAYRRPRRDGVKIKDKNDLLTSTDVACEELIVSRIHKSFPDDKILAEESHEGSKRKDATAEALWIIDPLDGTKNFVRRIPNIACSIAFVTDSQPVIGCVIRPLEDELKQIHTCLRWKNREDTSIESRVSTTHALTHAIIGNDFPKRGGQRKKAVEIVGRLAVADVSAIRSMGSATADSMRVAHGELDAYWHSRLSPWDIAASALFVQLAGGRVTRLDGSTWHVFSPDILASNGILHDDLLRIINDHFNR